MDATTRTVTVEVRFVGSGHRVRSDGGFAFSGGVVPPDLTGKAAFLVHREVEEEGGIWGPALGEESVKGGLQINLWADSEGYRELARYFLALAELNTTDDPGFHEHHEGLSSADGQTRLHLICRKAPAEEWPS